MSLEMFYEQVGGDLAGVRGRLLTDERITKFIGIFLEDTTYANLDAALRAGDMEEAFRAAHTLKGLSRDLGLNELFEPANQLADALRPGDDGQPAAPELADDLMAQVTAAYGAIVGAASAL